MVDGGGTGTQTNMTRGCYGRWWGHRTHEHGWRARCGDGHGQSRGLQVSQKVNHAGVVQQRVRVAPLNTQHGSVGMVVLHTHTHAHNTRTAKHALKPVTQDTPKRRTRS